jgi:cysteine desulfurase
MQTGDPIYLDHAATTPTDPRVVEAMLPYFGEIYGNPSSTHRFGRQAENAVENARETIAGILNCLAQEIVFTGCGTESDNLALRGVILAGRQRGQRGHILTTHAEHHAVSATAEQLGEIMDVRVTWLPVTREGAVATGALDEVLSAGAVNGPADATDVQIVSLMLANNEVGTIQPIRDLAALAHARGALFHTDAVQAAGQLSLDVKALGADLLSLSAHKFYGPKGVGLLYTRQGIELVPSQSGGGQEAQRRAGTHNVPLIVGMAKALELAYRDLDARTATYRRHRDRLIEGILGAIPGAYLTGVPGDNRLPNHASFVFEGIESNTLLMHLDMNSIAASSGSACNTGNPEPSGVLLAMGYEPALALGSLRLTVGAQTTDAQIDRILQVLPEVIRKIRSVRTAQTA